jgi:exodeoxyribonuclease VII small subunit
MATTVDLKELKFEQALKILEDISDQMVNSKDDLEEMLRLYEEGLKYLKVCREKLAEVEMKVTILNEKMLKEMPQEEENE